MGTPQLSFTQNPVAGRSGMVSDTSTCDINTVYIAETLGIEPGRLMVRNGDDEAVLPAASAVDVDAIIATGGSSASIQTLDAADFDGVIGADYMRVAQKITLVLSNHTDWDATDATLTGIDADGNTVSEDLAIPDGGNATVTSTGRYHQVTELVIPAQTSTGGTFTLGVAAPDGEIQGFAILGIAHLDPTKEPPLTLPLDNVEGAVVRGKIWVKTDAQVSKGERAWVRVIAAGAEEIGVFRASSDSGDALKVLGARFGIVASATLAELIVDFAD
jgi:hypothetical protein